MPDCHMDFYYVYDQFMALTFGPTYMGRGSYDVCSVFCLTTINGKQFNLIMGKVVRLTFGYKLHKPLPRTPANGFR